MFLLLICHIYFFKSQQNIANLQFMPKNDVTKNAFKCWQCFSCKK